MVTLVMYNAFPKLLTATVLLPNSPLGSLFICLAIGKRTACTLAKAEKKTVAVASMVPIREPMLASEGDGTDIQ